MAGVPRGRRKPKKQKPHIGRLVHAEMVARGLSIKAMAALADRPVRDLRDLFNGGLLRMTVADAIGRAFGTGAEIWLALDEECRGGAGPRLPQQSAPPARARRRRLVGLEH